jgi:DNA topoisomerase-1
MANSLVIVESPAKSKTIEKFLGKGYTVLASYGHVRALPSKQGSVDTEHDFEPKYAVLPESKKHIQALKKAVANADELILATDLDREGEAIAWHLLQALKIDEAGDKPVVKRVVFNEITKGAILDAMRQPRSISKELVDAQQARSILDYLVGFNLSPFLWKKIRYGLSAGRVQSVALRLICDRQKEIDAFQAQEYWSIEAQLQTPRQALFNARLYSEDGRKLDKLEISSQAHAEQLTALLQNAEYRVASVERKEKKRNPSAPFTTSTLQQEASRKLGFSSRKTMNLAQRLYEGIDLGAEGSTGLITYMRTDSVILSKTATDEAQAVISDIYGADYALKTPRVFKTKSKNAQEAHEAIRPTTIARRPEEVKRYLSPDQAKLYELIWKRTVASQMATAILDATSVDISAGKRHTFRATGQVVRFPGFMKLYIEGKDGNGNDEQEGILPPMKQGDLLDLRQLLPEQHFTQPPPRFTEASLVKTLEENGIGRPSTYASIIQTLLNRKYVRLEKKAFIPEDVGMVVNDLLVKHFTKYVDYDFTASLEEQLDAISRGEKQWRPVLQEFWDAFDALLKENEAKVERPVEETGRNCPECGEQLVIKLGRRGKFIACKGFPQCRHTEPLNGDAKSEAEPVYSEQLCDKCQAPMLIKDGRYGKFLACSAYPECKNIQPLEKPKGTGIACPECGEGELMAKKSRRGKIFYSCNRYPKCKYALWNPPLAKACPKCGFPILEEKTTKRQGTVHRCPREDCDYSLQIAGPDQGSKD